jgi:hypothetical protein
MWKIAAWRGDPLHRHRPSQRARHAPPLVSAMARSNRSSVVLPAPGPSAKNFALADIQRAPSSRDDGAMDGHD